MLLLSGALAMVGRARGPQLFRRKGGASGGAAVLDASVLGLLPPADGALRRRGPSLSSKGAYPRRFHLRRFLWLLV
eukprot:1246303-Pyramimonas_sp.AAC.1